jgi:type I restriction enzyme R subunit
MEKDPLTESESKLFEALQGLKKEVDSQILQNSKMLENESYIEKMMMRMVIEQLNNKSQLGLDSEKSKRINGFIVKEYINEYYGTTTAA